MKKIFIDVGKNNKVMGWGSNYSPNTIEIEVDENHGVLSRWISYRYENGTLHEELEWHRREIKDAKFNELSLFCQNDILGYFDAPVNSVTYKFSFDYEAQSNFTGTLALFTEGIISEMEWTAYLGEEAVRIVLDKANFLVVIAHAFQNKNAKISRLRNEIKPLIENAGTEEELNGIEW